MKRILLALSLVSAIGSGLVAQSAARPDGKAALIADLKKVEDSYFKYLSFEERRQALALMDSIIARVKADPSAFDGRETSPGSRRKTNVLNDEAFASLLKQVKEAGSESTKNDLILATGKRGMLASAQLKALLGSYSFDSYKEKLIKGVYPSIIDPVNLVIVLPLFDSTITRSEIADWLAEQGGTD